MGWAAPAAAIIGTGLQVAGSVANMRREQAQAEAEQEAAERNARLARKDARVAEQNALREMEANQQEGMEWSVDAGYEIGQLIAERAASGALMMGSNEGQVFGLRQLAARDQLRIRQEGIVRYQQAMHVAKNIRQQRANYQVEAAAAAQRSSDARTSGLLNIGSSIVGGAQAYQQAKMGV